MTLTADVQQLRDAMAVGRAGRLQADKSRSAARARDFAAWRQRRQEQHAAWALQMVEFHRTLSAAIVSLRTATAAVLAQGRRAVAAAAEQRRDRNVPALVAGWREQRLARAAAARSARQGFRLDLGGQVHRFMAGCHTARCQAGVEAAGDRRRWRLANCSGIRQFLATARKDLGRSRSATAARVDAPAPAPVAVDPATTAPRRNLLDTLYILMNSHPEGLSVVEAERLLGLPRVVVGQNLRRLADAGRVRRDKGLYFTID